MLVLGMGVAGCSGPATSDPDAADPDATAEDADGSRLVDADAEGEDAHAEHDDVFADEPGDLSGGDGDVPEGQWQSSTGGVDTAYVGYEFDSRIEITCAYSANANTQAQFHVGGHRAKDFVELTYDGGVTRRLSVDDWGVLATDCGSCAAYFTELLSDLRSHRKVALRDGDGRTGELTLYRADQTIPQDCRPNLSMLP